MATNKYFPLFLLESIQFYHYKQFFLNWWNLYILVYILFINSRINILYPLLNQINMTKIFHDGNKLFNKNFIYLLLFILIEFLFLNQMHIFMNMQCFDAVCYGGNCFVFCHDKIYIQLINHINSQFHIIWKHAF